MSKRNICTKIFSGLNEFIFDQIISILYHLFTTNKKYFKITVLSFASIFERGFFGRGRFLLEEDEDRSSPNWSPLWSMTHGLWLIIYESWSQPNGLLSLRFLMFAEFVEDFSDHSILLQRVIIMLVMIIE